MDITTLAIPSVVVVLLVQILKDLVGKVSARWGALAAQLTLLAVSLVVAGFLGFFQLLPATYINGVIAIFASAMVVYEVAYKAIYLDAIKGGK